MHESIFVENIFYDLFFLNFKSMWVEYGITQIVQIYRLGNKDTDNKIH